MRKIMTFLFAGVVIAALSVTFVGCNNESNSGSGQDDDVTGLKITQATGSIIGSYSNGFGSLLIQVDDKYHIGKTIEHFASASCTSLPQEGTFKNVIQVQLRLPKPGIPIAKNMNKKLSFSIREYQAENDRDLFTVGNGIGNTMCAPPDVPIYVITEYEILNN